MIRELCKHFFEKVYEFVNALVNVFAGTVLKHILGLIKI